MCQNKAENLLVIIKVHHILQLMALEMNHLTLQTLITGFTKNTTYVLKYRLNVFVIWTFCSAQYAVPFRLCRGLLLRCQTLTSPRRQRRVVHPECFPPAPKCCTYVATTKERSVWHNTGSGSYVNAHTRAV